MSDLTSHSDVAETALTRPTTWLRTVLRWMVSFAGYPLGGFAALLVAGPVDNLAAALAGGLLTGAILGAVQAWALGMDRRHSIAWVSATAVGLATGLGIGSSLVDYGTTLADLVVQGAVTGVVVGVAQAAVLLPRLGRPALAWPVAVGGAWAAGWAVTTAAGIQVDEQFTVFGSAGALVATALTVALPLTLDRVTEESQS